MPSPGKNSRSRANTPVGAGVFPGEGRKFFIVGSAEMGNQNDHTNPDSGAQNAKDQ